MKIGARSYTEKAINDCNDDDEVFVKLKEFETKLIPFAFRALPMDWDDGSSQYPSYTQPPWRKNH